MASMAIPRKITPTHPMANFSLNNEIISDWSLFRQQNIFSETNQKTQLACCSKPMSWRATWHKPPLPFHLSEIVLRDFVFYDFVAILMIFLPRSLACTCPFLSQDDRTHLPFFWWEELKHLFSFSLCSWLMLMTIPWNGQVGGHGCQGDEYISWHMTRWYCGSE